MDMRDMISKMNPEMLSQGLQKIGNMLTPEQKKQMEQAIKNIDKGELNQKLNSLNADDLQKELSKNPSIAKQLSKNPELMQKLNNILKSK